MFFTTDLVSRFSENLSTSKNTFLSLDDTISSFVYSDSKDLLSQRSVLFDSIDPERRPVLLFNQDSTEFIVNLLACWLSSRPVVPVCLPSKKRIDFINHIVEQTGAMIYTIDKNHSQVFKLRSNTSSLLSDLAEVTDNYLQPAKALKDNQQKKFQEDYKKWFLETQVGTEFPLGDPKPKQQPKHY